jgi:hypothetical protein
MSLERPFKDSSAESSPANRSRKRPASERRIQANRRNALRSTGPKTERGKRTVAGNAIKHGILAREVVITAGDGKESSEEFHDLVGQVCDYYEPIGVIEESLVQTIATCWWRKARVPSRREWRNTQASGQAKSGAVPTKLREGYPCPSIIGNGLTFVR